MPCDTFVALPGVTKDGGMIFGKNSDRPGSEVQEVVYVPRTTYPDGTKLKCTYIEVAQAGVTHAAMLSKPCWMWGAEMGANEHGVCIGNEAVWTNVLDKEDDATEARLLGMDLVRLGLERASTAKEAVDVITHLLETHGQGGRCFVDKSRFGMVYHNSFIIADASQAFVLETAGKHWALEECQDGVRNISNQLSIGTKISAMSTGLKEHAKEQGWWNGEEPFSFKHAFEQDSGRFGADFVPTCRFENGLKLLKTKSADGKFTMSHMMEILRDEDAGICMTGSGSVSTGSQVSALFPGSSKKLSHHWFTATPNPACSVYKPFIFGPGAKGSKLTENTAGDNTTPLFTAHARIKPLPGNDVNVQVRDSLRTLEESAVKDIAEFAQNPDGSDLSDVQDLFQDAVDSEMKFYKF